MKVYIFNNPYPVTLGGSFAFAIAETEEEAKAAILAQTDNVYAYGEYQQNRPNFTELPEAPTRVIDLEPGASFAEIYEWSE